MINEAATAPTLLPIWIEGMSEIISETKPYYPKFGKHVNLIIGKPFDTTPLRYDFATLPEIQRRKKVADFVQDYLFSLGRTKSSEP
jgi:monolysocardiolipin acyltransferase